MKRGNDAEGKAHARGRGDRSIWSRHGRGIHMEMVKSRQGDASDMTLAMLHDIRIATGT